MRFLRKSVSLFVIIENSSTSGYCLSKPITDLGLRFTTRYPNFVFKIRFFVNVLKVKLIKSAKYNVFSCLHVYPELLTVFWGCSGI